jgi:hypothetical protein
MPLGIAFWVIMLLWLLLGLYWTWPPSGERFWPLGSHLMLFLLFMLLGWKVFGPPLQ